MDITKFKKAKAKVEKSLIELEEDFFKTNYISLNRSVATYSALKKVYKDTNNDLSYYLGFKESFSQFYGIGRFVSDSFREDYYKKMNELRGLREYDIKELAENLIDKEKDKIQFSFVTKLLNIVNDEKYPIYDSNVMRSFGLYRKNVQSEDEKIDNYISDYEIITETYKDLLQKDKIQNLIKDFRKAFNCNEDMLSDMRIIDIIVWKIGEYESSFR
jgi:hypothetical protein